MDASFLPDRPDGSSEPMPDHVPPVRELQVGDLVRISEAADWGKTPDYEEARGKTGIIKAERPYMVPEEDYTVYLVGVAGMKWWVPCYARDLLLVKAAHS